MLGPAQHAVDGIEGVANHGYHSQDQQSPWIAINLEKAYIIKQIRIVGRAYFLRRIGNFKVQLNIVNFYHLWILKCMYIFELL